MTYYDDLIKDKKRVSIFKKSILQNAKGITYDLGTGSGILASFASEKADWVYAFEINPLVIKRYTKKFLENYPNVRIVEADASKYNFTEKPDVIICEMLDTALIDEEQVPVMNNIQNYTKDDTIFIPHSTYDTIQVGTANIKHITYEEYGNVKFQSLSDEITYNEVNFSEKINPKYKNNIKIKTNSQGIINSLLITTHNVFQMYYDCITFINFPFI